jgi:hypothetical protein
MRNILLSLLLSTFLFFITTSKVCASLLVIEKGGEVVWNVLADVDSLSLDIPRHSYIEVKEAAEVKPDANSMVSLTKSGEEISLIVSSEAETRELDVSGINDDLIEIEERAEVQKVVIGVTDNMFSLKQKGVVAVTSFPINIDSRSAELSVKTSSGDRFLSIFPFQAVEILLQSKLLNKITDNKVEIIEKEQELQYEIKGEKVLNFFDLVEYPIPVTSYISASTGEILTFEAPVWYKVVAYLFT